VDFAWNIRVPSTDGAVLPDCVVVAETADGPAPLMYSKSDDVLGLYMPLSTDRLLVASRDGEGQLPASLNEISASCSWDFFVFSERFEELSALVPIIGTRTMQITDDAIDEAMREYR
jgi:hypothetical protein